MAFKVSLSLFSCEARGQVLSDSSKYPFLLFKCLKKKKLLFFDG